jgi:FeS assembly SUF system regulator
MLRISRLTDYATVLLATLACEPDRLHTASSLAQRCRLGTATVSKILKQLQRSGLVQSSRGAHGGYRLAKPAQDISAAAILDALEGPLALTDCSVGSGLCDIESACRVGRSWQRVNLAIRRSLYDVSLAQLAGLEREAVPLLPRVALGARP